MNRISTWAVLAALTIGGAAMAGCNSHDKVPPGENGTRAGANGAFGGDTVQPGEGTHGMNGTDSNRNQMNMDSMH